MKDQPLTKCPKCKTGNVKRLIGAGAGLLFKGSGFYETDYKRKPAAASETTAKSGESKGAETKAAPAAKSQESSPKAA